MAALGAPPLAGFTLHQKLVERSLAQNAMLFDADRLAALNKVAAARGFEREIRKRLDYWAKLRAEKSS